MVLGYWLYTGHPAEALAANDRARQLDPFSLPVNFLRGVMLVCLRQDDRAVEQFNFAASLDAQSVAPHLELERIYWRHGRVPEALAEERTVATLSRHSEELAQIDAIAAAHSRGGVRAAMLKDLGLKERRYGRLGHEVTSHSLLSSPQEIALCYSRLHDKSNTLIWLNRAFQDDAVDFPLNLSLPDFDWLHSDSEFRHLLSQAGIPL